MDDVHDEVRLEAMKFLYVLSNIYPEMRVSVNRKEPVRVADYTFKKLCHAAIDTKIENRTMACHLLGSLHFVDENLILQTLNKKYKQNSIPTMYMEEDGDDVMLISDELYSEQAAAGAFIHGLEDEFLQVRTATIGR